MIRRAASLARRAGEIKRRVGGRGGVNCSSAAGDARYNECSSTGPTDPKVSVDAFTLDKLEFDQVRQIL